MKQGQKGIAILAPMIAAKRENDTPADGEEGKQDSLLGFRRVYVWDITQSEGAPLLEPEPEKVTGDVGAYQLTTEGQKYFQQIPGTFGQTGGLCYGRKAVDSVLKWTDPVTTGGRSQTEVSYTYKIVNLAGWVGQPRIQQAFPNIKATVEQCCSCKGIGEGAETRFWMLNIAFERFLFASDVHVFNELQLLT